MNFKVKCVKNKPGFTVGKIYPVVGGVLRDDDGDARPMGKMMSFKSIDEINQRFDNEFVNAAGNQSIVIYQKDREVIASLKSGKETIKTAKATYNPNDAKEGKPFDFNIGARLAFQRLMGEDKKINITIDTEKFSKAVKRLGEALSNIKVPQPFDWQAFKSGKFAVHCDTEEKAKAFLKECEDRNIKWNSGDMATSKTYYTENICYKIIESGSLNVASAKYYQRKNIDIVEYNPSTPSAREVHRPAKAGEWIKIEITRNDDEFSVGDILKVVEPYAAELGKAYYQTCPGAYAMQDQYVVLENYQPEEPKPERVLPRLEVATMDELLTEIKRRADK